MLLADMGARVIKIERPDGGDDTRGWGPPFVDGESAYFLSINRNKESVTLDFKRPEGRRVLETLIARADVLVENFRPGTLAKLGLGYDDLKDRHPRLVYCSISGFGQTGPRRNGPGYDAILQAEGGLMSITGAADGPPYRLGVAISDIVTGLFAAQGISLALFARERTGRGQYVDVGMLDSVAALLSYQAATYFATGKAPGRVGNRHPTIVPYEMFEVADGDIVVAVGNDTLWGKFCAAAGLEALTDDPRFAMNRDRVVHYETLRPILAERLRERPRQYLARHLRRRRRADRIGARPARGVHRSAAHRAVDGGRRGPSDGRSAAAAGRAHQTVGDAGGRPRGAAGAGPAHRSRAGRGCRPRRRHAGASQKRRDCLTRTARRVTDEESPWKCPKSAAGSSK